MSRNTCMEIDKKEKSLFLDSLYLRSLPLDPFNDREEIKKHCEGVIESNQGHSIFSLVKEKNLSVPDFLVSFSTFIIF